jgi:uncharacterized protein YvpB
MTQLKILVDTTLKQQPVQASQLPDDQKQAVSADSVFDLLAYLLVPGHIKVTFANQTFQGKNTWYVFAHHAQLLDAKGNTISILPPQIKLNVPYQSQLDNAENPFGSCNVTSITMCLEYFGVKGKNPNERLEDELQDWLATQGLDRHSPTDLAKVAEAYCIKDDFEPNATIDQVKQWLAGNNPVVVHGYFTSSGHVVCLIGYNDQGFIVNDPYGEWCADGYIRNDASNPHRGQGLTYSYSMIQQTCVVNGGIWAHFLSK